MEEARKAYENALRKLPKFRKAMANLGRVHLLQDNVDEAVRVYQSLVRDGQADEKVLVLLGHALLLAGQDVSAENAYRQALLLKPNDIDAMLGLARCLLQQERHREAVSLLGELLTQNADSEELWLLRANAYLALDRVEEALVSLESARRLGVASPEMLATLGDLYLNRQQPDEAVTAYEEAFGGKDPSLRRILRAAEGFMMIEDVAHAEKLVERAADVEAKTPDRVEPDVRGRLLRPKADLTMLKGDTDKAGKLYEDILREDPLNGDVLITLGDLRRQNGALEEAVMTYERAARISGHEARALVRQAQVEIERERYGRSVELLEAAQAFDEQPHVARYLQQVRRLAH